MDMRLLRQFVHLAETLHFGRASALSHVSPSALSRSIRQLEDQLGASLFRRNNRAVFLTPQGELFLLYARDALVQWDIIRHSVQERSGELQGEVSIYCSVTASYSFLFELLNRFRRDHPQIEIKLHTGDPEDAVSRVLTGSEDMSIGAHPESLPAGLAFKPIARTPLVFIGARNHPEFAVLGRRRPDAARWGTVPLILSETGLARRRVDSWLAELGVRPNIYAQVAGNEAIVSMVSLGFGVGVVPQLVLENSPLVDRVEKLAVRPGLAAYEVGLFTLEKKLRSPLISAFWSQLR